MYMNTCNWFHPVDIWHSFAWSVKSAYKAAGDDDGGLGSKIGTFFIWLLIPLVFYYIPIRCGLSLIVWAVYGPILLIARLCGVRDEPTLHELSDRHASRGWRQWFRGDYKKALIEYKEAIGYNAENEDAFYWCAEAYAYLHGRNDLSADEYYQKGCECFDSGDFVTAIMELTLSVKKNKENHGAYNMLAHSYIKLNNFGMGVKSLTKAIELCSPNQKDLLSERYQNRGIAYACQNKSAESKSN